MALDSYANLKTAVAAHLERDDLTDNIDDFIDIAEARHQREIRIREMLQRDAITVNARQISLPAGFLEGKTLRLLTDPVTALTEVNLEELNTERKEGTGKPKFFAIHKEIEFDVTPDSSYSGEIIFYKAFTALSGSATSNALLVKAPDAYLYGALVAASPFIMHDERIQVWNSLYEDARDRLNGADKKGRHIGPIVSRVSGQPFKAGRR